MKINEFWAVFGGFCYMCQWHCNFCYYSKKSAVICNCNHYTGFRCNKVPPSTPPRALMYSTCTQTFETQIKLQRHTLVKDTKRLCQGIEGKMSMDGQHMLDGMLASSDSNQQLCSLARKLNTPLYAINVGTDACNKECNKSPRMHVS